MLVAGSGFELGQRIGYSNFEREKGVRQSSNYIKTNSPVGPDVILSVVEKKLLPSSSNSLSSGLSGRLDLSTRVRPLWRSTTVEIMRLSLLGGSRGTAVPPTAIRLALLYPRGEEFHEMICRALKSIVRMNCSLIFGERILFFQVISSGYKFLL